MKIINLVEDTAGNPSCGYEHGLSFYIETEKHRLLVDSGATDMFLHNAEILNVDLKKADLLILSHGHYDHSGGILAFAEINPQAKIYMQKSADGEYYHVKGETKRYIGIDKHIAGLPQTVLIEGNLKLDDELFLFSGIQKNKPFPKGNLELKKKEEDSFVQDDFEHEQYLVITEKDKNILISGCAHNGILNILDRYYDIFHAYPHVVISGFHMMKKEEYTPEDVEDIKSTARALLETKALFFTGHCTGQKAFSMMKEIMGDSLKPLSSGGKIEL